MFIAMFASVAGKKKNVRLLIYEPVNVLSVKLSSNFLELELFSIKHFMCVIVLSRVEMLAARIESATTWSKGSGSVTVVRVPAYKLGDHGFEPYWLLCTFLSNFLLTTPL